MTILHVRRSLSIYILLKKITRRIFTVYTEIVRMFRKVALVWCVCTLTVAVTATGSNFGAEQQRNESERIIFGVPTKKDRYPGFVALIYDDDEIARCGGALIASNVVLTAAHCIANGLDQRLKKIARGNIRLEEVSGVLKSADEVSSVAEVVMHPRYMPETQRNDVALVILNQKMSKLFAPVAKRVPKKGSKVHAVGLGLNNYFPNPGTADVYGKPTRLYEVEMKVGRWGKDPCPAGYELGDKTPNPKKQVCVYGSMTKNGWKSICNGDSGGPIFNKKGETFGVASWGPGAGGAACLSLVEVFDAYTSVPYYYDSFIKPNLKKYS